MRKYLWVLVLLIPISWIAWGLTAKEQGNIAYGNVITAMDEGAASFLGVDKPGAYVGNRNGKALPAVRGGIKLIVSFENPSLGFRALTSRIFKTDEGTIFFGTLVLWIILVFALVFIRRKKAINNAQS